MATVLITGGTGLIGKALTRALLQQEHRVIILSRKPILKRVWGNPVTYANWDLKKQEMDLLAIKQADHIIHLAGAGVVEKKWTEAYKREIRESRTESSRLLIDALKNNSNRIKTIVSISAIGFYGSDRDPVKPFEETDLPDTDFLSETCQLWEESIKPVTELGKKLIIIRTGIVLSKRGGALEEFKKPLRLGVAAILGNGKQAISWIHIDDLCRMLIYACRNNFLNGTYNAVAPTPVNNETLTLSLAKKKNGKFYIPMRIPEFILKLMMGQRSIEVLKSCTVSSARIRDSGFVFEFTTIEEALNNLCGKQG